MIEEEPESVMDEEREREEGGKLTILQLYLIPEELVMVPMVVAKPSLACPTAGMEGRGVGEGD
jgi:hypothetical protein